MLDEHTVPQTSDNARSMLAAETARLARQIYTLVPHDGSIVQPVPGLLLARHSQIDADYVHTIEQPSLWIAAQGEKAVTVGKEVYSFGVGQMFIVPVALPVAAQTTLASPSEPVLGVRLDLNPQRIAELVLKVYPHGLPPIHQRSAGYVTNAELSVISAVSRLVECLSDPGDIELVAPLVVDEILIRVLRSPIGVHAAEMGFADSGVQRVAKAIDWLRNNFAQQMKVADLADLVHLSVSSFNEHFKSVTSMSPLQYQKALRLHEARRLMLSASMDATTACRLVGYVSTSQFSRDYSRFFGSPPSKDIARWRQLAQMLD